MAHRVTKYRTGLTGCSIVLHSVFYVIPRRSFCHTRTLLSIFLLVSLVSILLLSKAQAGLISQGSLNNTVSVGSEIVERAKHKQLDAHPYWHTLLHYAATITGSESLIDDPGFFLSPDGKSNPIAELEMTLENMFSDQTLGDDHTLCRYPARAAWLKEELDIVDSDLPQPECSEYNKLIAKVAPTSAELVFPGPHINSPASMFGHTLLTIKGEYESKLLTFAINYAAQTNESNGFFYAVKGIFGVYPGRYSILPYYEKVREYGDMERRDIWEYRLNLTETETRRLANHSWELKDSYSDYFFFGENCSFNLLFLLEAARPGVQLTGKSRRWVIPIDTIRQVEEAGLIESSTFRPSKSKRIERLLSRVSNQGERYAFNLSRTPEGLLKNNIDYLTDEPKDLFDLAIEDLDYQYLKQALQKTDYQQRYVSLLSARSKLGAREQAELEGFPPEQGHRSSRISLFLGQSEDNSFVDLSFRPGYHNLHDPASGYPPGAQIEYLHALVRLYEGKDPELEQLDVVNIFSVSPRNLFFPTTSWKIYTGARRIEDGQGTKLIYEVNPGVGWAFGSPTFLWYVLGESRVGISDDPLAEIGSSSGIIHQSTDGLSNTHLRMTWFSDIASDFDETRTLDLSETITINQNLALQLRFTHTLRVEHESNLFKIGLSTYW